MNFKYNTLPKILFYIILSRMLITMLFPIGLPVNLMILVLIPYALSAYLIYTDKLEGFLLYISAMIAEIFGPFIGLAFFHEASFIELKSIFSEIFYGTGVLLLVISLGTAYIAYLAYSKNLGRKKFDKRYLLISAVILTLISSLIMI